MIGEYCPECKRCVEWCGHGPKLHSSVPGDSLRKIRELVDAAIRLIIDERPVLARLRLERIREICSNENRSGKEI